MQKIFLLLICNGIFILNFCFAQITFQKTYGRLNNNVGAFSGQLCSDGGFVFTGWEQDTINGKTDVYLTKTNSVGDTLWTKLYGGSGDDKVISLTKTKDDGFIISGWTDSTGTGQWDIYLIKTDSMGNLQWAKTFGGTGRDWANSAQQTYDGGYVVIGTTESFLTNNSDIYMIKTDSAGNLLWSKIFFSQFSQFGEDGYYIKQTIDSGFIITAFIDTWQILLIKTNSNGTISWQKLLISNESVPKCLQQTSDKGYIIIGRYYNTFSTNPDVLLIKTDSLGNVEWAKTYGGISPDFGEFVQQTNDGGYILTGSTSSFVNNTFREVYLIKTDSTGNIFWSKHISPPVYGLSEGYSVCQTTDDGYIIFGYTDASPSNNFSAYLIKTDSLGNTGCNNDTASTIVTNITFQDSIHTLNFSSGCITNNAVPALRSGGILTTLCTSLNIHSQISNSQSEVIIFPNPSSTEFQISNFNFQKDDEIILTDALGKISFSKRISSPTSNLKLQTFNFSNGIYFLEIKTKEGVLNKKMVVQH